MAWRDLHAEVEGLFCPSEEPPSTLEALADRGLSLRVPRQDFTTWDLKWARLKADPKRYARFLAYNRQMQREWRKRTYADPVKHQKRIEYLRAWRRRRKEALAR